MILRVMEEKEEMGGGEEKKEGRGGGEGRDGWISLKIEGRYGRRKGEGRK